MKEIWTPEYRLKIIAALALFIREGASPYHAQMTAQIICLICAGGNDFLESDREEIANAYRIATGHELPGPNEANH